MAYTAIETRKASQHASMLSKQMKIQRKHRSNATRWMHDPDDIIPTREPDHMGLKDWCKCMAFTVVMTVLMCLVWWYGG